jgi:hypothetical protein
MLSAPLFGPLLQLSQSFGRSYGKISNFSLGRRDFCGGDDPPSLRLETARGPHPEQRLGSMASAACSGQTVLDLRPELHCFGGVPAAWSWCISARVDNQWKRTRRTRLGERPRGSPSIEAKRRDWRFRRPLQVGQIR